MAGKYPPSYPELLKPCGRAGEGGEKRGEAAAVGVDAEVFTVFSQDKVLQRFVEQIMEDVTIVGEMWVQQRFVEQNLDARVCWGLLKEFHTSFSCSRSLLLGTWTSSTSPLYLAATCPCGPATDHGSFSKNFLRFPREGELGGPRAVLSLCFSDSVNVDVEFQLSGGFF